MNTILSMCGSVLASFAVSIWIKGKFSVIDLFNGSLSGCIGAGSSTGLFVNPCACMMLGAISSTVCCLGMEYLTGWLERNWKIFDTFSIHNVRGLPGIIGGLGGAIGIAVSYTIPNNASRTITLLVETLRKDNWANGWISSVGDIFYSDTFTFSWNVYWMGNNIVLQHWGEIFLHGQFVFWASSRFRDIF